MNQINKDQVIAGVQAMSKIIIANEKPFCELDSVAGDGDFGMSLSKGFRQLQKEWSDLEKDDIGTFMKTCGMIITEHCGGASGPIWGSAFRGMGRYAQDKQTLTLHEMGEMLQSAVDAIQKRGGAKLGDKTLLDALIPLAESVKQSALANEAFNIASAKAKEAAIAGAESTCKVAASKGRASYLGERSIGYPDAGATAIGIIISEMLKD